MLVHDWIKDGAKAIIDDPILYKLARKTAIGIAIINQKEVIEKEQNKLKELEAKHEEVK